MCKWIESDTEEVEQTDKKRLEPNKQCKIKIPKIEKIPNMKVYFTHRIIDEIFRFKRLSEEIFNEEVSKIRRPIGLYRSPTKDYVISSKSRLTDLSDEMDLRYVPDEPYSAGLSFPEDIHDSDLERMTRPYLVEMPVDWAKAGIHRVPVSPVDNRFLQSLFVWTGLNSKDSIEGKIKESRTAEKNKPVQWSDKDWWNFGKAFGVNIFQTKYVAEDEDIHITKFLKSSEKDSYAIVLYTMNDVEILLSRKKSLRLVDLPRIFHNYLDSGISLKYEDL